MKYQTDGDVFRYGSKQFTVGGDVFANGLSSYAGLFGTVSEILTEEDRETENDTPDIYCEFRQPESAHQAKEIEDRFTALYGMPMALDNISLDCVVMAPDMLEPIPAALPEGRGQIYTLSYYSDSDGGCASGTLGVSFDKGNLLRMMLEAVESQTKPVVLSHVQESEDEIVFQYEARDTGIEDLYLSYTIALTAAM